MSQEPTNDRFDARPRIALDTSEPPPPDVTGPAPPAGPHLLDYLKVIHRRRWPAAAAFLIVFMYIVVGAFTEAPTFEARAKVLIEAGNPNVVNFASVVEEGSGRSDYYETQYNLLRSRSLVRRTLATLKKEGGPTSGPAPAAPGSSPSGAGGLIASARATLASALGRSGNPPVTSLPDETVQLSSEIDGILGSLRITPVRNSRIVDVVYRSANPGTAAKIVNAHVRSYIEQNLEFRFLTSKEATDWLGARLAESREEVTVAESALQRYLEKNRSVSLGDGGDVVVQRLGDVSVAVVQAKTARIEKEAAYKQVLAVQRNPAMLDTLPAILGSPLVQQYKMELAALQRQEAVMREKLLDRHPDLVKLGDTIKATDAKLQVEIGRVVQSVKNDFLAAETREQSLTEELESQKREALSMNQKAIDYGVLRREAASARQIYETLLQRTKETGVSSELRTSNLRIIDLAEVPRTPISPNKRASVIQGLVTGLLIAIGVAVFFEYVDNRIRRPDEITAWLGLPLLGMIPMAKSAEKGSKLSPLVNNGAAPAFAEAIRTMRTNVLFSSAEDGPRTLAITSSGPNEGKTTVASNLSIALAQSGLRVLLIDVDMRRPAVHERFGLRLEPGLSHLLVGSVKANEVVTKTSVSNLWILPAGRIPPNPAELLASRRFKDILTGFREHFDWIVMDTPPILAVTDAAVVAHSCSGVVLVVGVEMVSRQSAKFALGQLDAAQAHVLGAVLNLIDFEHQTYYYSHYYSREYSKYYAGSRT